jgi:hypothetical protein
MLLKGANMGKLELEINELELMGQMNRLAIQENSLLIGQLQKLTLNLQFPMVATRAIKDRAQELLLTTQNQLASRYVLRDKIDAAIATAELAINRHEDAVRRAACDQCGDSGCDKCDW